MVLRARRGIPHLESIITLKGNPAPTLNEEEFKALFQDDIMTISNVTEKTDGLAWIIGYDVDGFFTMHSGSTGVRARAPQPDHIKHARDRNRPDLKPYEYMDDFAEALYLNHEFHDYLMYQYNVTGQDIIIRGEAFINALALETPYGFVYNRIPYEKVNTTYGMFVIHSQLEDNKNIDIETILSFSDNQIRFDQDKYEMGELRIHRPSEWLNLPLDFQKYMISRNITGYMDFAVNCKWGYYREGIVVHPDEYDRPRFKIVSEEFKNAQRSWK